MEKNDLVHPSGKTCGLVRVINGLDSGGVSTKLTTSGTGGLVKATAARILSIRSLPVLVRTSTGYAGALA